MSSRPESGQTAGGGRLIVPVLNSSSRIPALDGLRGMAILLVLLRHSVFGLETTSPVLAGLLATGRLAWSGVDLFFVLSGFLIGGILLDARQSPRYFRTFYIRRAYRIFPLYGLVTALFLFRHLPFRLLPGHFGNVSPLSIPWWSYITFTQNFFMVRLGWFGPQAMSVSWSLAVEEQFYLTIPLLIWLVRPKRSFYVLVLAVIGAPVLRILLGHVLVHGDFARYVLTPCRADALSMGVLSAMLVRNPRAWHWLLQNRRLLAGSTAVLFAGVVIMTYLNCSEFAPPMNTFGFSWMALFYTGCLLLAVSNVKGSFLHNPALRGLGTLAYCCYLVHAPLIEASRRALSLSLSRDAALWSGSAVGLGLTLFVAKLSWKYFEKPLLRRGHRFGY